MLNTAVLMGRLTADPELRHTTGNIPVTSFTLAVDRSYVKTGAERATDFIDIVAWRTTAEFVCKYFHKGQLVAVQGTIQTRLYQDKEGNRRKAFEIVADTVHFAEPKRDAYPQHTTTAAHGYDEPASVSAPIESNSFENGSADDFQKIPTDDDLPF